MPYFCYGFTKPLDSTDSALINYFHLVELRNDLLHGNINIKKLAFNELYFLGKVPIFNGYSSMWDRSLGVAYRTVGVSEVRAEIEVVDRLIEYLYSLLDPQVVKNVKRMMDTFDLGVRKDTGRLGILFGSTLVDFAASAEGSKAASDL